MYRAASWSARSGACSWHSRAMLGRLPAKGLLALAMVVIAATFVALMITSRGPTEDERASHDQLEKYAVEQQELADARGCRDSTDHAVSAAADYLVSRYGDGAADAIRQITRHRCEQDHWSSTVLKCLDRVTSDNEMQRCVGQLEGNQQRAVEAEMKAFVGRPVKVIPDATQDIDDPDGSLPYACRQYEEILEKVMTCDKLPQASRDALKQALDAMKSGWTNLATMPEEARQAMSSGCQSGVDAMNQSMASICGW